MTHTTRILSVRTALDVTALVVVLIVLAPLAAPTARAGTYTVSGTCGLWDAFNNRPDRIAVYPECGWLKARNVGGPFSTPAGASGGWIFSAPAGTSIMAFHLQGPMEGTNGWQATGYLDGGPTSGQAFENCPGTLCPGAYKYLNDSYSGNGANAIVMRLRCGSTDGCPNNSGITGYFYVAPDATVTLADGSPPSVALAGGALLNGGWKSGSQTLVIDTSDNSGIQSASALIDGAERRKVARDCNYGQKVPCSNGPTAFDVSTAGLGDGPHRVSGQAVDASGNVGGSSDATVYIDNTPPTQPLDVQLRDGPGWRSTNSFEVSWRNPPQGFAPISAAIYQLCPTVPADANKATKDAAQAKCVQGARSGANPTQISDLKVPEPGWWHLRLWLADAAGNQQPASAVDVDGLAFDDAPPTNVAFLASDPQDPARVHLQASDPVSGLASGVIEVRRDGHDAWVPLQTELRPSGLTASIDDETLPKGTYFLRARVADHAGLEASTDRLSSGEPATIRLPIRLASHLAAGRRAHRHCHGRGRHPRCRSRLATEPRLRVGRPTRLHGRLTIAGKPTPGATLEVWRQLDLAGAPWARIDTLTTSKTGRFSYRARRGPARTIRFRYPGSPTIRGHNADVKLRVRASSTLRPSRRTVINGEYVTFRGRLPGGWVPPGGVLVELQVFSRGQWRTFTQPRSAPSGRWVYRYRFETVRGHANFRFRARIRRQPDYPFTTGVSRAARVRVRGL